MKLKRKTAVASVVLATVSLGAGVALADAYDINVSPGQEGLVIKDTADGPNGNLLLVKDWKGQPIFNVLRAGGASVLGDDFRVFPGTDIYNPSVWLSPNDPSGICNRVNQLYIGGTSGGVWRCTFSSYYGVNYWKKVV